MRNTPRHSPSPNSVASRQNLPAFQVALITGAGRGIGRATAELLARMGTRVVLCARSYKELDATVKSILHQGGRALAQQVDISRPHDARHFVQWAIRHYKQIDLLINNASILGPRIPLTEYPVRAWEQVLHINLHGTYFITRAVLRNMLTRGQGRIISLSSSVGRTGRARWGAYAVSKFGVEGLTQVLADELGGSDICAVTFNPGRTRTRMRAAAYPEEDPRPLPTPADTAKAIVQLATSVTPSHSGFSFDIDNIP